MSPTSTQAPSSHFSSHRSRNPKLAKSCSSQQPKRTWTSTSMIVGTGSTAHLFVRSFKTRPQFTRWDSQSSTPQERTISVIMQCRCLLTLLTSSILPHRLMTFRHVPCENFQKYKNNLAQRNLIVRIYRWILTFLRFRMRIVYTQLIKI